MSTDAPSIQPSSNQPWFYGRAFDLIFGCGLIYIVLFPILLGLPGYNTILTVTVLAMFIAGPHYGATYLRILEDDESRRRYGKVTLWITTIVGLAFVMGLYSVKVGALLIVLYMTWSPWHVSGQNYGVCLMFLRRRNVTITPLAKRLLYSAFWLSFAPALLVLHSGADVNYIPVQRSPFEIYPIMTLGIPRNLVMTLVPILVLAYIGCLACVTTLLLRTARVSEIAPSILIVVLQSMWFVVPGFLLSSGYDLYSSMAFVPVVQSAVHSIQYLWVSSYYTKREQPETRLGTYLFKAMLAGAAGLGAMVIFFGPGLLGTIPYDSGLSILAASALNVHHFALDGVIWKLRSGPVARALLGEPYEGAPSTQTPIWYRWLKPAAAAVGVASLVTSAVFVWEMNTFDTAGTRRFETAVNRLRLIGRDSALMRREFATRLATIGNHRRALEEIDRSLELLPNSEAWILKGQIHERDHYWQAALEAYEIALRMDPDNRLARTHRRSVLKKMSGRG